MAREKTATAARAKEEREKGGTTTIPPPTSITKPWRTAEVEKTAEIQTGPGQTASTLEVFAAEISNGRQATPANECEVQEIETATETAGAV